jgi:hypothetical protein
MQIVPQSTRELNTFRTMPYKIQSLFGRINRFGATPNRICSALRRGASTTTNTAVVEILFLAPQPEIPLSIGSMLTVLEKYNLMNWYNVDIEKKAFIKDTVWRQAIRQFAELCLVQLAKYRKAHARATARGSHEPTTKYHHEMEPLARIQGDGTLVFSLEFTKELKEAHGLTYVQPTNDTNKRDWIQWVIPKCIKYNNDQRPLSTPFLGRGLRGRR